MTDPTNPDDFTPRACAIVELADKIGLNRDLEDVAHEVLDGGDTTSTPVHTLFGASFEGDDDFDELRHEILHVTGDCQDGDPECIWEHGDEMDF